MEEELKEIIMNVFKDFLEEMKIKDISKKYELSRDTVNRYIEEGKEMYSSKLKNKLEFVNLFRKRKNDDYDYCFLEAFGNDQGKEIIGDRIIQKNWLDAEEYEINDFKGTVYFSDEYSIISLGDSTKNIFEKSHTLLDLILRCVNFAKKNSKLIQDELNKLLFQIDGEWFKSTYFIEILVDIAKENDYFNDGFHLEIYPHNVFVKISNNYIDNIIEYKPIEFKTIEDYKENIRIKLNDKVYGKKIGNKLKDILRKKVLLRKYLKGNKCCIAEAKLIYNEFVSKYGLHYDHNINSIIIDYTNQEIESILKLFIDRLMQFTVDNSEQILFYDGENIINWLDLNDLLIKYEGNLRNKLEIYFSSKKDDSGNHTIISKGSGDERKEKENKTEKIPSSSEIEFYKYKDIVIKSSLKDAPKIALLMLYLCKDDKPKGKKDLSRFIYENCEIKKKDALSNFKMIKYNESDKIKLRKNLADKLSKLLKEPNINSILPSDFLSGKKKTFGVIIEMVNNDHIKLIYENLQKL